MAETRRTRQQAKKLAQQKQSGSTTKDKMSAIPCLSSEIIEKIIAVLPLPEVCNCMLVCKEWKELLSAEQFCKNYVLSHYDFDDEEEPSGHLQSWSDPDECFYYWDENDDKSNMWVFSDPPKRWKCGIVHLADYALESHEELKYKDFLQAVYILTRIQNAAQELELDCGAWGNEGTGVVETCLFPWTKDTLPTAEDVITRFRFNPEMHKDPLVDEEIAETEDEENSDDEDSESAHVTWNTLGTSYGVDVKKANTFFNWMQKIFSPMIRIAIGCESMNPVPCFILAKIAPGWVGGVLTSLALT